MPAADGDKGASGAQHTPLVVCARCSSLLLAHSCSQNMYGAIFHSVSVPDISASTYLSRHLLRLGLAMKDEMTEATVLHLLVLLDRLHTAEASSGFHLCSANVHRVLLALIVISAKLVDDEPYTNAYWASCRVPCAVCAVQHGEVALFWTLVRSPLESI